MSEFTMKKTTFSRAQWLAVSAILFFTLVGTGLVLVMLLNGNVVNHVLTPVFQYTSLFSVLWDDKPLGALRFIINKSLVTFTYKDPRSTLNLWTYDFDFITTLVYVSACLIAGRIMAQYWFGKQRALYRSPLLFGLAGLLLTALSTTYMSVIDHCAGPTWVGFVSLYGMGLDEFELYPAYQFILAIVGIALLGSGYYQMSHRRKTTLPL
jgi:hypothetical protein